MDQSRLAYVVSDAMRDCLSLGSGDRVVVFYDNGSVDVYNVIRSAGSHLGSRVEGVNIDDYDRPLREYPDAISRLLSTVRPEATFYVAGVRPGELPFRSGLVREATGLGASHVHMPKANLEILSKVEGCRETARIIESLAAELSSARSVEVETRAGTRVLLETGAYRWVPDTGVIERGRWGNWPPGEVFTTPSRAEGVLVVDGVLGDYFSTKYGVLEEPVTVYIEEGRVVKVDGGAVARELYEYLSKTECGLRIGELGIGGNPRITRPIGIMLHDEKMPGAHIAAGDPLGSATGAGWKCPVHVDMLPLRSTVRAGTKTLVDEGRLLV